MNCEVCGQSVEYDEQEDGICFECINEEKFGDLKNDKIN